MSPIAKVQAAFQFIRGKSAKSLSLTRITACEKVNSLIPLRGKGREH